MRKQYYFRVSPGGLLAWDVDRLVHLSRDFPVCGVPLAEIRELDEAMFGEDEAPTWRAFAAHLRLVQDAELKYPIIAIYRDDTGTFLERANATHPTTSIAGSQHLSRFSFGMCHRARILRRLEQLPVMRSSGQGQRASSRARGGNREEGTHYHQIP